MSPGRTENAENVPAVFVPYVDGDQQPREPWYREFLVHLSTSGGRHLAAAHVGVSRRRLSRAIAEDPEFAEQVDAAEEFSRDLLEHELISVGRGRRGNVLAYFGKLKAERPARWVEKAITLSAQVETRIGPADPVALLRRMLPYVTPPTWQILETDGPVVPPEDPSRPNP